MNGWYNSGVIVDQQAAANQSGLLRLRVPPGSISRSHLVAEQESGLAANAFDGVDVSVQAHPLDVLVQRWSNGVGGCDFPNLPSSGINFVLVNTQGAELQVLQGASMLLHCGVVQLWIVKVYSQVDALHLNGAARHSRIIELLARWN